MHCRAAVALVVLAFAAACESPTANPPRLDASRAKPLLEMGGNAQECAGLLINGEFDNVVVPPGGHCLLVRSIVHGNVRALEGANLTTNTNQIGGNIEVERGAFANLTFDVVGGNVTIVDGVGTGIQFSYRVERLTLPKGNIYVMRNSGGITVGFNDVRKGSIRIEDNVSNLFAVRNNVVREHILVLRNLGPAFKIVRSNVAGESIQCYDNEQPFFAELNSAPRLEGQCAEAAPAG